MRQTCIALNRALLYARYSTDKQRETSIDDQLRSARSRAAHEGWIIVGQRSDEGISGTVPVAYRPGGKAMLADALAKRFDILVVEGLDRLSREIGEAETITKRLEHRGIRIVGTADGYDSDARGRKVMRIARGLVNELYLDDLREKTHRGLAGQFDRGFHVGGLTYGYKSQAAADGRGQLLVVDEEQARVVRWVFQQFADGYSTKRIVHLLNERGMKSARGGTWAVSAVQGSSEKGLGLLNNELYLGRQVWNRRQWLKDPETGKRRYVDRPRDEWQVREVPELRIVSDELWEAVHTRARNGPARGIRRGKGAAPRTLFGAGVLRCAACGAAVVAINRDRYGCSARKDRGPSVCPSGHTVRREVLDQCLISELRDELLTPTALAELRSEVQALLPVTHRDGEAESSTARRRSAELDAEIGRLVDAIAQVGISEPLRERLRAAEAERSQLQATLAAPAARKLQVDEIMGGYRHLVLQLQHALEEETDRDRTRSILAQMLGTVVLGRDDL